MLHDALFVGSFALVFLIGFILAAAGAYQPAARVRHHIWKFTWFRLHALIGGASAVLLLTLAQVGHSLGPLGLPFALTFDLAPLSGAARLAYVAGIAAVLVSTIYAANRKYNDPRSSDGAPRPAPNDRVGKVLSGTISAARSTIAFSYPVIEFCHVQLGNEIAPEYARLLRLLIETENLDGESLHREAHAAVIARFGLTPTTDYWLEQIAGKTDETERREFLGALLIEHGGFPAAESVLARFGVTCGIKGRQPSAVDASINVQ